MQLYKIVLGIDRLPSYDKYSIVVMNTSDILLRKEGLSKTEVLEIAQQYKVDAIAIDNIYELGTEQEIKNLVEQRNILKAKWEQEKNIINEIQKEKELIEKYKFEELKNLRYTEKVKIIHQVYLESKDKWKENFMYELSKLGKINRYSLEEVSPSLSIYFINKVFSVIIVSIILMSILVILIFRLPLPSLIVLSGATIDLIICLGFMGYSGIPLTLASFTALMIMVGLSLDTDMMLCIKILKIGEGNPKERAYEAMQTGFAMTTTTLAAFVALLVLGELTKINVYQQIGLIGTVGLIGDLIGTWLFNAVAVLYYKEKLAKS